MRLARIQLFFLIVSGLFGGVDSTAQTIIRHNAIEDSRDELVFEILKLAVLSADPRAKFIEVDNAIPPGRLSAELDIGGISVLWGSASPAYESKHKAVRLPVLKGLMGHRIFMVHQQNQDLFKKVRTLGDLKKFSAGLGRNWGDVPVLKTAGLPVVTAAGFDNLIHMLDGQRFDYFPRGVHEPWSEVNRVPGLELIVEPNIMLVFPMPMHFYVKPEDAQLHDLIYRGLEAIMLNGEYEDVFYGSQMVGDALEMANIANRRVIRMDNPNLHPDTPLDRKELWLEISALSF